MRIAPTALAASEGARGHFRKLVLVKKNEAKRTTERGERLWGGGCRDKVNGKSACWSACNETAGAAEDSQRRAAASGKKINTSEREERG